MTPRPIDVAGIVAENRVFNLAQHCLAHAAQLTPDKVALDVVASLDGTAAGERWTYRDLERAVLRVAGGLHARGFQPGTRLLIRRENTSAYPILFLGAIAAGLIAIPASSQLTASETDFLIGDSGASVIALADGAARSSLPSGIVILSEADVAAMIEDGSPTGYAPVRANDAAYLIYTSGTTAHPKGVVHAQRVILGRRPMYDGWYAITPDDRVLHAGAFNWTYTLGTGLMDPLAVGATSVIYTGAKTPEIWPALIRQTGATMFAAVPSLMRQILKYAPPGPIDVGHLRHGLIAGERPPEDLFDAWRARTGTQLYEALGMSELSTYISSSPNTPRVPGTTGRAQPGRCIAIISEDGGEEPLPPNSEGLIAVDRSDPGLMLGYWQRPNEEAEVYRGRWFIGGDRGVMARDGSITHLGRANDLMKALGYRVSPQEVEAVLAQCPGVAEVACAQIAVRSDVTIVGAYIVVAAGANIDAETVAAFATERLADYKRPREIVFVSALPRTANGKVRRNALASLPENSKSS